MPEISSHQCSLVIPMYNLSTTNRFWLGVKIVIALFVVTLFAFAGSWPTALEIFLKGAALFGIFCAFYALMARVSETEINLDQGIIIQRRAYPMLFPERCYKLGDFSLIKSTLAGRSASWVSVALSGVGGEIEIARFDPGNEGKKWDSLAASNLRRLLVERLHYRDLGFV